MRGPVVGIVSSGRSGSDVESFVSRLGAWVEVVALVAPEAGQVGVDALFLTDSGAAGVIPGQHEGVPAAMWVGLGESLPLGTDVMPVGPGAPAETGIRVSAPRSRGPWTFCRSATRIPTCALA